MPHFGEIKPGDAPDSEDLTIAQRVFRVPAAPAAAAATAVVVNDASLTIAQRSLAARNQSQSVAAATVSTQVDILATQIFGA